MLYVALWLLFNHGGSNDSWDTTADKLALDIDVGLNFITNNSLNMHMYIKHLGFKFVSV